MCRVDLAPLSRGAVDELARRAGRAGDEIHRATGGNPFFVTEVLAGARDEVAPRTVRDAVLARAARLDPSAREVIELVSVVPGRAELWLVEAAIAPSRQDLEACLAAGMLESDGEVVRFRHEIARSSVEAELSPLRRRELERSVLAALLDREGVDLARVVHHARRAADRGVVLAHAPAAARAASAAGAHVQAAEHYRAALAVAEDAEPEARAALLEGLSFETYLAGPPEEALASRQDALAIRTRLGQTARVGEDERWLSRILWWLGRGAESEAASRRAIAVLEPLGPSTELAMAYSGMSQLMMLSWRIRDSIEWGDRAIELARRLNDGESLAHALTNVGTALSENGDLRGDDLLQEAVELALAEGFHDHAARAIVNLGWNRLARRRYAAAAETIETGLAFAGRHDLSFYTQYLLGMRASWGLDQGDWPGAEVDGRAVLAIHEAQPSISGHPGLLVLGRLLARRGEGEADGLLDTTWAMATEADEPQRIVPAGCAAAELAWLAGDLEGVERMGRRALDSATRTHHPQLTGEAAFWLWRGGRAGRAARWHRGALPALDARRLARRRARMGAAGLPLSPGRGPLARRRGAGAPAGARDLRRPGRGAAGRATARGAAAAGRHVGAAGTPARDAREPPGPDASSARGAGAARRGGHERRDRRAAGAVHPHRGPPRGGRSRQAGRHLAPRRRGGGATPRCGPRRRWAAGGLTWAGPADVGARGADLPS